MSRRALTLMVIGVLSLAVLIVSAGALVGRADLSLPSFGDRDGGGIQSPTITPEPGDGAGPLDGLARAWADPDCAPWVSPPSEGEVLLGRFDGSLPGTGAEAASTVRFAPFSTAITHWHLPWGADAPDYPERAIEATLAEGSIPMITWEPWTSPAPGGAAREIDSVGVEGFSLEAIIDGEYDGYIQEWAESAADHGAPLLLRPMPEPNGFWYPWSMGHDRQNLDLYAETWRHLHGIFEEAGADQVRWVWSVNVLAGLPAELRGGLERLYPGRDHVDWVATIGLNWGETEAWSEWAEPAEIFLGTVEELEIFDRPIMISGAGTVDEGGDPLEWTERLIRSLDGDLDAVRALVWFDAAVGETEFGLEPEMATVLDGVDQASSGEVVSCR